MFLRVVGFRKGCSDGLSALHQLVPRQTALTSSSSPPHLSHLNIIALSAPQLINLRPHGENLTAVTAEACSSRELTKVQPWRGI